MNPLDIAVRAIFVFVFLLLLVRLSGKRTIKQGTVFDFVLALVFGDLVDDVILGEAAVSTFVVAASTFFVASMLTAIVEWRLGARQVGR